MNDKLARVNGRKRAIDILVFLHVGTERTNGRTIMRHIDGILPIFVENVDVVSA